MGEDLDGRDALPKNFLCDCYKHQGIYISYAAAA
jgi:hypothetical protein